MLVLSGASDPIITEPAIARHETNSALDLSSERSSFGSSKYHADAGWQLPFLALKTGCRFVLNLVCNHLAAIRGSLVLFAAELFIKCAEHRVYVFSGHVFAALRQHFLEVFSRPDASRESCVFRIFCE